MKRISLILIGVAAFISISASGQNLSDSRALELGWMELPEFSEDESPPGITLYGGILGPSEELLTLLESRPSSGQLGGVSDEPEAAR